MDKASSNSGAASVEKIADPAPEGCSERETDCLKWEI